MTTSAQSFGQWVRERRKQRNLTQKALGQLTGYAEITVRQIEHDTYKLTRFVVERFVSCLDVEGDDYAAITSFALKQLPVSVNAVQKRADYRSGTPFIGRETELAHIADLLRNPECRCISIVGVGGVGKTRLAARAFAVYTREASQEAWFVTLTEIASSELMARTIADVIGIPLNPFTPLTEQLLLTLQSRQGLLVLDNFEQLLPEGTRLLEAMLARAPSVKIIITSRERLLITGEWMIRLQGLDITDDASQSTAVNLFVSTARRMNNEFIAGDLDAIREICLFVQGIPLAIEMAASWTELSSYAEILSSVSKKALDLTSRHRDLDERHRSLRAVFETTWERLSFREQQTLKRLAVFRGGFTVAAAQHVAEANLDLLAYLQDKMLIQPQSEGRLVLHEIIRQLALQKLIDSEQELLATELQHGEYYMQMLSQSAQRIKYNHTRDEIVHINSEIENVRAAWEIMLRQRRTDWFYACYESLWLFFNVTSRFREGESWFQSAADAFVVSNPNAKEQHISDFSGVMITSFMIRQGRIPEALALLSIPRMDAIRNSSDPFDRYFFNFIQSYVFHAVGNGQAALVSVERGLQALKLMGDDVYAHATSYFQIGRVHHLLGDSEAAYQYLADSLRLFRNHEVGLGGGLILTELGFVAETNGQINDALAYYEAVLTTVAESEDVWNYCRTQISIGRVKLALRRIQEAIAIFYSTLQGLQNNPQLGLEIDCFVEIALILEYSGDCSLAIVLLEYCSTHPECYQPTRNRAMEYLVAIQKETPHLDVSLARNLLPTAKSEVSTFLIDRLMRFKAL